MERVSIEKIGPREARKLLDTLDERQRPVAEERVIGYADDMLHGRWRLVGDAITIINGKLSNGQHRLEAILRSKCVCKIVVLETKEDCFDEIDTGTSRSLAFVLSRSHDFASGRTVAAIAMRACLYDKMVQEDSSLFPAPRGAYRNRAQELALLNRELIEQSAVFGNRIYKQQPLIPASIVGTTYFLCHRVGFNEIDSFIEAVITGVGLVRGTPAYAVNTRLVKSASTHEKLSPEKKFHLLIKGFLAYRAKEETWKLVVGDAFPRINGATMHE